MSRTLDTAVTTATYARAAMAAHGDRAIELPGCQKDTRHVGVVFVHGIGSQAQGEILRDWGGAITRVLVDFRVGAGQSGDPVVRCQLDPSGGAQTFVELQVAASGPSDAEPAPAVHWVLTEAWWAHEITPPSFGQMAQWLGPDGAIPQIVKTILPRQIPHDPRASQWSAEPGGTELPDPPVLLDTRQKRMAEWRRQPRSTLTKAFNEIGAWVYLQALAALVLLVYGTLRSVETLLPIGPLANGALTRPIDRFVLEWFGDVFVLLGVPTQAATVRGRLSKAIRDLKAASCEEIVVVAHSGGAVVAWTTLVAEGENGEDVDTLVTIGEGLNLAWNITSGDTTGEFADEIRAVARARERFGLLYEPLMEKRQTLHWVDYWGSRDPAPTGPVDAPAEDLVPPSERFTNLAIWNLLSFREDHGAYWDNDEEFVIPLLRRLEVGTDKEAESFFGPLSAHETRSNRRRRRVSVVSLWKQLCLMAPTAAIITSYAIQNDVIPGIGDALASAWNAIPGSQLVSGPVNAIRDLNLQDFGPTDMLAEVGVWVVAAIIASVAWFALISPPERPAPWVGARLLSTRVVAFLVGSGPVLAAVPLAVGLLIAAWRFFTGATPAGIAAALWFAPWVLIAIVVAVVVRLLSERWPTVRIFATAGVLFLASYLIVAPFAAVLIFPEVGQMVLGSVGVIVGFGIVARIGTWRWRAWDLRDRFIGRSTAPDYPTVGLVAIQAIIFLTSLGLLYVAVGFELGLAAVVALALLVAAVFIGIAIDVSQQPPRTGDDAEPHRRRTKFEGFVPPTKL